MHTLNGLFNFILRRKRGFEFYLLEVSFMSAEIPDKSYIKDHVLPRDQTVQTYHFLTSTPSSWSKEMEKAIKTFP